MAVIRNLSIKARLMFVIALLSVLLIAIGGIGLYGMKAANAGLLRVYAQRTVPMGQIAQIQRRLLRNRLLLATALVTPTPQVIRENTGEIEQNIAEITEIWDAYKASRLTPGEEPLANKFGEERRKFVQAGLEPAVTALRSGDLAEAHRIVTSAIQPLYAPVAQDIDALLQRQIDAARLEYAAAASRYAATRNLSATLIVAGTLLGVLIGLLLIRAIMRPLQRAVALAEAVAGGDLSGRIDNGSNDEVGKLLQALARMTGSLNLTVAAVHTATDTITMVAGEIVSSNTDLANRTQKQTSTLQETAASMEELTSTVEQNARNAKQANQLANGASAIAAKGGDVVREVVDTMSGISDSSRKIVDIISMIDGIAFQTNILALNAAVEAARAGEQGRGFAVVAAEVRSLAQRSATAAKEIKLLISDSAERVATGTRLVDQAGATMEEVVKAIERVTELMGALSLASREQSSGIEQVNQAIMQMDEVARRNAALVEEAAAAAASLRGEAQNLASAVAVFRIDPVERPRAAQAAAARRAAHASSPIGRGGADGASSNSGLVAARAAG